MIFSRFKDVNLFHSMLSDCSVSRRWEWGHMVAVGRQLLSCLLARSQSIVTRMAIKILIMIIVFSFNSLTPICLLAGINNYRSVEFLRRSSTFFRVFQNTTQPPTTTTMVSRLPLLRKGLGGYAQSNTWATLPRVSVRALSLGFI